MFNAIPSNSRVMFDEEDNNGLVLCDKYLSVEVLIEIFCHADCKTLLRCQLVCRRWKMLMSKVWHKKTERTLGKQFPWNDEMPWSVYYFACAKKSYARNLVKNHSGAEGMDHWKLIHGSDRWRVEEPPVVPELPQTEPLFKDRQICFVASTVGCIKQQAIDLTDEGIHSYILDTYQPPIVVLSSFMQWKLYISVCTLEVSEWYGCRYQRPSVALLYELKVQLFDIDDKVIDRFQFRDVLKGEKQNQWLKVSHVFEKYGHGVRYITFEHSGRDPRYFARLAGFCRDGCKMAGACVYVKIP